MRVLVVGQSGQLAQALTKVAGKSEGDWIIQGRPGFDLTLSSSIDAMLADTRPEVVINAAAWTNVEAAETQERAAYALNAEAVAVLAKATALIGSVLIQVSTDYVFDGRKGAPYVETDDPAPLNVYGQTKRAGEIACLTGNPRSIVVRTSWIYSPWGANFVKTMLRLSAVGRDISVVEDQIGSPTSAEDLATGLAAIASRVRHEPEASSLFGSYHLAAPDHASWADFAEAIFNESRASGGTHSLIKRIPSRDYPQKALRPPDSRLDSRKVELAFGLRLPSWRDGLKRCIADIRAMDGTGA